MASETLKLTLQPRKITGKNVSRLRTQGILPIAICGRGVEPYSAQVDEREFMRIVNQSGYTGLIELVMEGMPKQQAFLQELQRNSLSGRPVHADLKVVDVNRPMEIDVPIIAVGENAMVEKGQALLNHNMHTVHVRALPTDIPHQIDVDISTLTDFDQTVHIRDLMLPATVEVLSDLDGLVFALAHPRVEVEETDEVTEEAADADADTDSE